MKRVVSLSLAFLLVCAGFSGLAAETVDVLVGDTVDIWVSIYNGGTAVLTPKERSPAPTQSRIVLSHGGSDAFHVKITDVGIFRYTLSVEPDGRSITFDSTVYDVEIHAMYADDVMRAYIVMYNHITGEKYTPTETYDTATGTYTHRLNAAFVNYSSSTSSLGSGKPSSSPDRPPNITDSMRDKAFGPPEDWIPPQDDPNTPPQDSTSRQDDPNAHPHDSTSGQDDPNAPPDGSTSGRNDPNAHPHDSTSGQDDPNAPPDGSTSGRNDPNAHPHDSTSGQDDPNAPPDGSTSGRNPNSPHNHTGSTPDSADSPLDGSDAGTRSSARRTGTANDRSSQQPKTGDDSRLTYYLLLAIFASAGLFAVSAAYYISSRGSHETDSK